MTAQGYNKQDYHFLGSSKKVCAIISLPDASCSTHDVPGVLFWRLSMKELELTQGKVALVSDSKYEKANQFKWHARRTVAGTWYATRNGRRTLFGREKPIQLHRFIVDAPEGFDVDHIDGDGLNCQDENLRVCTHSENMHNTKISKNNTTGYKGVYKSGNRYRAHIKINGEQKYLGSFTGAKMAADAYDAAAKYYFGDYALPNTKG